MSGLLALIGVSYAIYALLPPLMLMAWLLVIGVSCLGMGNGAVFQLVPQRFQSEIGVATGVVGAFGGLGGFLLPTLLGSVKQVSGSFAFGFLLLALASLLMLAVLRLLAAYQTGWRTSGVTVLKGETTEARAS